MTELIDNPPPLPEHVNKAAQGKGGWGIGTYGPLFTAAQYRAGEAAAFARGVVARQAEIDELKNDLAACNARIKQLERTIDGINLRFAGAKQ